jgi:Ca2+-binding RTX toxin-like protein
MGPAYSDGEDRLIGRDGDDLIIGNGGVGRFEPGRGDDIIFGSYDVYDVSSIHIQTRGTVIVLN